LENANYREKITNFLYSEIKRKMILSGLLVSGVILIIIASLGIPESYQFVLALGVSLLVGILIGFYVGNKIGWPLGFWLGLIGGLLIAPLVALLIGDSVSAYYASFLGPIVGALVGRWTELNDKRMLKDDIDKIIE